MMGVAVFREIQAEQCTFLYVNGGTLTYRLSLLGWFPARKTEGGFSRGGGVAEFRHEGRPLPQTVTKLGKKKTLCLRA